MAQIVFNLFYGKGNTRGQKTLDVFEQVKKLAKDSGKPQTLCGTFYTSDIRFIKKHVHLKPSVRILIEPGNYYCEFPVNSNIVIDSKK